MDGAGAVFAVELIEIGLDIAIFLEAGGGIAGALAELVIGEGDEVEARLGGERDGGFVAEGDRALVGSEGTLTGFGIEGDRAAVNDAGDPVDHAVGGALGSGFGGRGN